MNEDVLTLSDVSKRFHARRADAGPLGAGYFRRKGREASAVDEVAALAGVSFTMRSGEAVAVLGRNGAGKSTLLQIIAGTMRPTTGEVFREGRLSAMLELGFGFNPDFSGRENIALAASIYGIGRKELKALQPAIEEFSEIGDFLDRPLRTYSTGMVVRLAFAIITVSKPQVLIIDEALSVGDIFFQAKCIRWMEDYLAGGGTLLCATHDFTLIQKLCQRALVLHRGTLVYDGEVNGAIKCLYRLEKGEGWTADAAAEAESESPEPRSAEQPATESAAAERAAREGDSWETLTLRREGRTGDRRMELLAVESTPGLEGSICSGEWVRVRFTVQAHEDLDKFDVGLGFRDRTGQLVGGFHSFYNDLSCGAVRAGETVAVEFAIQLDLRPQDYLLIVGLAVNHSAQDWVDLDCLWDCAAVTVVGKEHFWGVAKLPFGEVKVSRLESSLAGGGR